MAQRSTWQDKYGYGIQTSSISTSAACTSGIFLMNHPNLDINTKTIDTEKTVVSASRNQLVEFAIDGRNPTAQFPIMVSPKQVYPFLRLFFQKGSLQDSTTNTIKWFFPYSYSSVGNECEVWGSFVRELSTGSTYSQRIVGAICNSLTLVPSDMEYMTMNCGLTGRDLEVNHNTSADTFTLSTDAPLLWRNCVTKIGNSYTVQETCDLKRFEMLLLNSAKGRHYNNSKVQRFNLGKFYGTGAFTTPWENSSTNYTKTKVFDDFYNGTVSRLSLYWNDEYATSGYSVSLNMLVRHIKVSISDEKEVSNISRFMMVEDASFSYENSKIASWTIDGSDASKIIFTYMGSETLIGNVFPGDVVLTLDAITGSNTRWVVERIVSSTTAKLTTNHTAGVGSSGSNAVVLRQPISVGLNDMTNRLIT